MQNGGAGRTTLPAVFPAATDGNPDDDRSGWTGPDPFRSRMLLENRWRRAASPGGDLPDPLEEEAE
jgi:hypothetical protein